MGHKVYEEQKEVFGKDIKKVILKKHGIFPWNCMVNVFVVMNVLKVSKRMGKNVRQSLIDLNSKEDGGLSGKPIKELSTEFVKKFYKELNGKIPIIGVGGVDSGESAFEKIAAGASAVQLYTGLIYKGPNIVKEIKKDLIQILKSKGFTNINEAVGSSLN